MSDGIALLLIWTFSNIIPFDLITKEHSYVSLSFAKKKISPPNASTPIITSPSKSSSPSPKKRPTPSRRPNTGQVKRKDYTIVMNAQVWFDGLICCGPVKAGGSNAYQKGLTDAILSGKVIDPDVLSVTDHKNKLTIDSDIVRFQGKHVNLGAYARSYTVYVEEGDDQEKKRQSSPGKDGWTLW